jgi:uncharacterized protein (TIGR03435 family)
MTRLAAGVFITSVLALAQTAERPAFEVASMKANHSGGTSTHSDRDNNRLNIVNMTLKRYIGRAYSVREDQIVGPGWLDTERFDLVAKSEFVPTAEQVGLMLQALLAERFKLALHRESREGHVYAMMAAKGGLKVKPVAPTGDSSTNSTRGTLDGKQVSMDRLAKALSQVLGLDVVDQTGVAGVFDVKLAWDPASTALSPDTPAEARPARDSGPSIFTALQEQLGLKLESRKMPVEILVIDHVERVPTEN